MKNNNDFVKIKTLEEKAEIYQPLFRKLINIMDTVCIYTTRHSFADRVKIENLDDDDGYNQFKNAIITIGHGDPFGNYYHYASYDVGKDILNIKDVKAGESSCKEISNATDQYLKIINSQISDIRNYIKGTQRSIKSGWL